MQEVELVEARPHAVPDDDDESRRDAVQESKAPQMVLLGVGVCLFGAVLCISPAKKSVRGVACVFLVVWLWLTRCVGLAVASLVPVVLFPLTGAAGARTVSSVYLSDPMMLLLGSLLCAGAVERHGLHTRLARFFVRSQDPIAGIVVATFLLSMWISNTATASMMAPLASSVATTPDLERSAGLAVAFASSLGGLTTLTGTGPNVVLAGVSGISFAEWLLIATPVSAPLAVAVWRGLKVPRATVRLEAAKPWTRHERVVVVVLALMSLLWLTRQSRFGLSGWAALLPEPTYVTDGTVAMAAAIVLFVSGALPWSAVNDLGWDVFFLVSGGMALAVGARESGLDSVVASLLAPLPGNLGLALTALAGVALSNVVSNAAAANILLPLVACGNRPFALPPVAMSCSLAFLFPVSTPPNAIAMAHFPHLTPRHMAINGAKLTLLALVLVFADATLLVPRILARHQDTPLCGDDGGI
ncbi:hypothetical protein CTAYLR_000074 [Chrysophaeum taylorii]|uniref:Citrate transporter-like domain-containing protein n=1 Tax=Chrysophaeum taylorii TaxID=2483200 RepID=A0AAD7XM48_9STRA|nr:hypothetical protein CTAYLR_000074 [Chrysophaeum taylorii]